MGILTLLRNAFGRGRKGRPAEAESADHLPTPRQEHDLVTEAFDNPKVPSQGGSESTKAETAPGTPAGVKPAEADGAAEAPASEEPADTAAPKALDSEKPAEAEAAAAPEAPAPAESPKAETAPSADAAATPEAEAEAPEEKAPEIEPLLMEPAIIDADPEVVVPQQRTEPLPEAEAEHDQPAIPEQSTEPPAGTFTEPALEDAPTPEAGADTDADHDAAPAAKTDTAPEPTPAPKAEAESEPTPAPKAEAEPDADAKAVAEPEPAAGTKPAPEAEGKAQAEAKAASETAAPAEADAESAPAPEADAKPATTPAPKPKTKPKAKAPAETEAEAETEAATEAQAAAQPEPKADAKATAPESKTKPKAKAAADAKAPSEPEPEPEPTADAKATAPNPKAKPKAKADAKATAEPETEAKAETESAGAGGNTAGAETLAQTPSLTTAHTAAAATLAATGLTGTRAKLYLVLDRSASMRPYYKDGSAQALADQTLALAAHLDEDPNVHVVFFSTEVDGTTDLTLTEDHATKIDETHAELGRMGRTSYHAAVEAVLAHHDKHHTPEDGVLVVFQTDGAPDAKTPATQALTNAAKTHPKVFFSFVAFGEPDNKAFDYLRKLKTGNTSFFHAGPTPRELTDNELYEGVLAAWRP